MKLTERASKLFQQQLENDSLNRYCREEAAEIINVFLQSDEMVSADDLVFIGSFLRNSDWHKTNLFGVNTKKLPAVLFDHYYPRIPGGRFYHFTTFDHFSNIIGSKQLWLFNLLKRKSAEYFRPFYEDHGLLGYDKKQDGSSKPYWEKIMQETFYASFANPTTLSDQTESALWRRFADNGLGVRLEIQITPNIPDFRVVYYRKEALLPKRLIMNQISEAIMEKFERIFTVSGISKMGAFYVDGDFEDESEVRLIIKANTDDYPFRFKPKQYKGNIKFIQLPFSNKYAPIRLVSVQPGIHRKKSDAKQVVFNYKGRPKPIILDNSILI